MPLDVLKFVGAKSVTVPDDFVSEEILSSVESFKFGEFCSFTKGHSS